MFVGSIVCNVHAWFVTPMLNGHDASMYNLLRRSPVFVYVLALKDPILDGKKIKVKKTRINRIIYVMLSELDIYFRGLI